MVAKRVKGDVCSIVLVFVFVLQQVDLDAIFTRSKCEVALYVRQRVKEAKRSAVHATLVRQ